jgi:SulP family sulfate permease
VNRLLDVVQQLLNKADSVKLEFLVLDFRYVTGLDSSAALGFAKLHRLARSENFTLLLTSLDKAIERQFELEGLDDEEANLRIFPDLDYGLEWCENKLLVDNNVTTAHVASHLKLQLADLGFDKKLFAQLQPYLERQAVEPGDYLMRQGEEATDLFFVEIGQVSIFLELENGHKMRLRSMQMGTIVGEVAFYLGTNRSASVLADTKAIVHRLTQEALERMRTENPAVAIALTEMMIRVISDRLNRTNRTLAAHNR